MRHKKLGIILLPLFVAALNIMIIIFPRESLAAARGGLMLWSHNVLPGILPFVIGANLLMALGGAGFIGELLSPITRAVFRVPGRGGFALAIGLISGYPVGTKVVCEMRSQGHLTKIEAQRLVAFTSNAGPLFVLGAVAAGMFGSASLGYFMLAAHYLGALSVGLIMRFYKTRYDKIPNKDAEMPLHIKAFRAMEATRQADSRSFGLILGACIKDAVETMLIIGGFVVLFSVVSAILELSGVFYALSSFLEFFGMFHVEHLSGFIEMTNGVSALSAQGISLQVVAACVAIISFGGLSILFQSINFIAKTDISIAIFVLCKMAHGAISGLFSIILFPLFSSSFESVEFVAVHSPGFVRSSANFILMVAGLLVICMGVLVIGHIRKSR